VAGHPGRIYGLHAVQAALEVPSTRVEEIWLADERDDKRVQVIQALAAEKSVRLHRCERATLDEMMPDARHQGCIADCKPLDNLVEKDLLDLLARLDHDPFLLVLDGVQDPHNLGACMRTAEAAGMDAVIAPKDRASTLTPTAIKISSGAAERLPFIQVTNLARVLRDLQQAGVWLVGTSGDSDTSLYQADLKGPIALILGAEGKGIRRLTRDHCDQVIYIPMQGETESLNVSVAAGVCAFEAARQRNL
jgi:23S rRNA (guanosine2251-2'-O)-methyltransferase